MGERESGGGQENASCSRGGWSAKDGRERWSAKVVKKMQGWSGKMECKDGVQGWLREVECEGGRDRES